MLFLDLLHMIVPVTLSAGCLIARSRMGREKSVTHLLAAIFAALCAYSVYVGGDVWDSLQYANRYVTPAMPGLLVLSALAIDDLLRERRRVVVQGVACLFLFCGFLTAMSPVTLQELPLTPFDERMRIACAALTLMPILVLPLLLLRTHGGARRLAGY